MLPSNYPELSFIDNKTVDELKDEAISLFLDKYEEITGEKITLAPSNPYRLIIYSIVSLFHQNLQLIDRAGKMNTIRYAYGDFLSSVAEFRGTNRKEATSAVTVLEFTISDELTSVVPIPEGTTVTNGSEIYFVTDEYAEIPIGETSVKVSATCTVPGAAGDVPAGTVKTLVNVLPFITGVTNTIAGYGGADVETDEELRDRIYDFATSYYAAGTINTYQYNTKEAFRDIEDVYVDTPEPGHVDIYFSLKDGEIPTEDVIDIVTDYLSNSKSRFLTDYVEVKAPTEETYDINLTYWISESNKNSVETITAKVNQAIADYNEWQSKKIGRDINPSVLTQLVMDAGAKRVVVESPIFTEVESSTITKVDNQTISYGGIEND